MSLRSLQRAAGVLLAGVTVLLVADSAFLATAATPDGLVVPMQRLHLGLGVALSVLLPLFVGVHLRLHRAHRNERARRVGLLVAGISMLGCLAGAGLWAVGKSGQTRAIVLLHEGAFVAALGAYVVHRARAYVTPALRGERVAAAVVGLLVLGIWGAQVLVPSTDTGSASLDVLRTGLSRARTLDGHTLTAQDLRTADYCGGCHGDVQARWEQSAHRFSSLNNPYYAATVQRLQAKEGNEASAFCGGCHDPVLLLTGRIAEPLEPGMPDGDAGIPCLTCHAVVAEPDRIGNGGYVLARPDHYPGYGSDAPEQQELNRRLIRSKPAKHRATFGHAWLRSPSQCLTCHKAHLPPELTGARWHRGQNDFDPWHDSGAGGFSARTFYPPQQHQRCIDCHMPRIASDDPAAKNGTVADHAFPGANTALPHALGDEAWLERSADQLRGVLSVDIVAATSRGGRTLALPDGGTPVPPGRVELDVVVRNRASGHLFPGGVADLREAWLEVTVEHDGAAVAASGWIAEDGTADPGAHRWHTVLLDDAGRWLRLHDVEDTSTVLYSHRILLGASDLVRVAFEAPESGELAVRARVLHRKFDRNFQEFALGPDAPRQPIVAIAADERRFVVGDGPAAEPPPGAGPRLRDLGIGHLLRGDTGLAAEAARAAAARMPDDPGPWLDLARGALHDGDLSGAEAHLRAADQRQPGHPTAAWLLARVRLGQGRFDEGLAAVGVALAAFPRDRELLALKGRILLKAGRAAEARAALEAVLAIDPEHVGAHSHLARACRELGDTRAAERHLAIWERLRPDVAEKTAVAAARRANPALDRRSNRQYVLELSSPPAGWAPASAL